MDGITIRPACAEDAEEILSIYAYYVEHTAVSFEVEVPSVQEFRARITRTLGNYPYFVAVQHGKIIGYAYAGAFHGRAAYRWSAELTVYIAPDRRRCGLGRQLYSALENSLAGMGILNLYACVAYPETEDAYLTRSSRDFHRHLGFREAGRFYKCGYKFNRWYHMIWMEKIIGPHEDGQAPVRRLASESV